MPRVIGVGSALPSHRYSQAEVRRAYAALSGGGPEVRGRLSVFARAGVGERRFCLPLSYHEAGHGFGRRNRDFIEQGRALGAAALRGAARAAGAPLDSLGHLLCATTTGLATPSLEALIAEELDLPRSLRRTPIFGIGCAAGAVGLARAAEYLRGRPSENAAALAVELCSLSFRRGRGGARDLVAAALFADGAACAWLAGDGAPGAGPEVVASESHLFPRSRELMGWEFSDEGMDLMLSPRIPVLIRSRFGALARAFLRRHGLAPADVRRWVLHPGGARVLDAYQAALGLSARELRFSRRALRGQGNLSSASVLMILKDVLENEPPPPGSWGLLAALGPGFASELVLLRW